MSYIILNLVDTYTLQNANIVQYHCDGFMRIELLGPLVLILELEIVDFGTVRRNAHRREGGGARARRRRCWVAHPAARRWPMCAPPRARCSPTRHCAPFPASGGTMTSVECCRAANPGGFTLSALLLTTCCSISKAASWLGRIARECAEPPPAPDTAQKKSGCP